MVTQYTSHFHALDWNCFRNQSTYLGTKFYSNLKREHRWSFLGPFLFEVSKLGRCVSPTVSSLKIGTRWICSCTNRLVYPCYCNYFSQVIINHKSSIKISFYLRTYWKSCTVDLIKMTIWWKMDWCPHALQPAWKSPGQIWRRTLGRHARSGSLNWLTWYWFWHYACLKST